MNRSMTTVFAMTALVLGAAAAAAAAPAASARVSWPTTDAPTTPINVLTGDSKWLLFAEGTVAGAKPSNDILARSRSGSVSTLPGSAGKIEWSVRGNIASANKTDMDDGPRIWFNLSTGDHGVLHFTKGQTALGPTAHGYAYITPKTHTTHLINLRTGKRTPFKAPHSANDAGFTTGNGIVYTTDSSVGFKGWKYQTLVNSHSVTKLAVPVTGGGRVFCRTSNSHYLGCYQEATDSSDMSGVNFLIPLDGSAPTASTMCTTPGAVAGDTLLWATSNEASDPSDGCTAGPAVLDRLVADGTDAEATTAAVLGSNGLFNAASAYGKAIFVAPDQTSITAIDSDGGSSTLAGSPLRSAAVPAPASSCGTVCGGYYLSGVGKLARSSTGHFTLDRNGGAHAVVTGAHAVVTYFTKRPGRKVTHSRVPGHYREGGNAPTITTSANGRRVLLFEDKRVAEVSAGATVIRRQDFVSVRACLSSSRTDVIAGGVGLPRGRTELLVGNDDIDAPDTSTSQVTCQGTLGGQMSIVRIPGVPHLGVTSLTRDAAAGHLVMVGSGSCSRPGAFTWTSTNDGRSWGQPNRVTKAPTGSCRRSRHATQFLPSGVTADRGTVWISGLRRHGNHAVRQDVYRSRRGQQFRDLGRLPHAAHGSVAILQPNPRTGAIHAVFDVLTTTDHTSTGIVHEYYKHRHWSGFRYLSHKRRKYVSGLQITKQGHPVIAYGGLL